MRSAGNVVIVLGLGVLGLSACTTADPSGPPSTEQPPPSSSGSPSTTPTPRPVPPKDRVHLGALSAGESCDLLDRDTASQVAFPVEEGEPRNAGVDPQVPGCQFDGVDTDEQRSVLLGIQPAGFAELGREEVELDDSTSSATVTSSATSTSPNADAQPEATRTLRANSCTVYVPAGEATLQVAVRAADADSEQCDTAEALTAHITPALQR